MKAQQSLRYGAVINVEGVDFVMDGDGKPTAAGDWYIAERNGGPRLMTVKSFAFRGKQFDGPVLELSVDEARLPDWINPVEQEYAYDYDECCKVKPVEALA